MHKMAIEGSSRRRTQPSQGLTRLVHRIVRRPGERAVFHFIGQTIARNNRYQVYLAMYCGTGLALAAEFSVTFQTIAGRIHPALSNRGLHAIMPLLLFWVIAGLRAAFAFPLNLPAGWIFRTTGVSISECAAAARTWVLFNAIAITACVLVALRIAGWNLRLLLVQLVCGLCLCTFLTDSFFHFHPSVPFNRPRMPGKTSLPLMLTLYIGAAPPFVLWVIDLEKTFEKSLSHLVLLALITAAFHVAITLLRDRSTEVEEEIEGYEGEFQLLGLS